MNEKELKPCACPKPRKADIKENIHKPCGGVKIIK